MQPCLFIWIPKTAGTSMVEACSAADGAALSLEKRQETIVRSDGDAFWCVVHRSCGDLRRRGVLAEEEVQRRFVFTFVRNPWDRMVSVFSYARNHAVIKRAFIAEKLDTFEAFVRCVTCEPIDPVWHYRYLGLSIANPQSDWLRGIDVDYIGRFERLNDEWDMLCRKLGIANEPLPHRLKSRRGEYAEYYTAETRRLVARFCAEDIDRFGYTF